MKNLSEGPSISKQAEDRAIAIDALRRLGFSLIQIGSAFNISKQAVHQIIVRFRRGDIKFSPGARKSSWLGVPMERALGLNDGRPIYEYRSNAYLYRMQMNGAKYRGIAWEFNFETWLDVWVKSGKFSERGRGGYCMGRYGDVGPYSPKNVYITRCEDNVRDGFVNRRNRKNVERLTANVV